MHTYVQEIFKPASFIVGLGQMRRDLCGAARESNIESSDRRILKCW